MKRIAILTAVVLAIAACSSEGSSGEEAGTVPAPTTTEAEAPATSAAPTTTEAPADDAVDIADTSLGQVLVDEAGNTLYMFTADTDGTSTCYDDCEAAWPFVPAGLEVGAGVEADLGETTREGGQAQLTINGRPVYLFAGDAGPGDVNGQGVNGVWFVLGVDGEPINS